MKKATLLLLLLLLMAIPCYCINHMDLIQTMTGEFNGSEFGFNMASIDFNADGYDDLVVSSSAWNPNGIYNEQQLYGKLYFFWGGPSFNNVPDLIIPGTHYLHYYGKSLFNAGDINGDGHDDLVISNRDSTDTCTIETFYGRINPHNTPDTVLIYPLTLTHNVFAFPLGDINGDNHADLGFYFSEETQRYGRRLMILTDILSQPMLFRESIINSNFSTLAGVGDVNNDGFDDFFMNQSMVGTTHTRMVLFFGNTAFPSVDSLVIVDDTQAVTTWWGNPVGDVNGDDYDEFVAYGNHLWLGSNNMSSTWNTFLTSIYGSTENFNQFPFQYGDLNNDGFDDVVSSNKYNAGNSGVINIWMGRSQMNGTVDLNLWDPIETEICNFGWAKAVGDYNGDNFDDIAVSAPWWNQNDHTEPGKVCIFAGNGELQDTTVSNDDNTNPSSNVSPWDIQIYPNPVSIKSTLLSVKLVGSGYKVSTNLRLEIFNIKGQKLMSKAIPQDNLKEGNLEITLKKYKPGIYIFNLYNNNIRLTTHKFSIKQ